MRLVVLLFVLACLLPQSAIGAPKIPTPPTPYTYDYLLQRFLELDVAYRQLPPEAFASIHNISDVHDWINEAVPYFEYEGVTDTLFYPSHVEFVYFDDALTHLHVLGRTYCRSLLVELNERYINQVTALYDTPDLLTTIVHELAHVQGLCKDSERLNAEVSAQLATLEVLASMVNKGNVQALASFVDSFRTMIYGALYYAASNEGRLDELTTLRPTLAEDAIELAQWEKSDRYWFFDPHQREQILYSYYYTPVVEIFAALDLGSCSISLFPETNIVRVITFDAPCVVGAETLTWPKNLYIDDIEYVLNNLDEISASL